VEKGETLAGALVRELREELGVEVKEAACTPLTFACGASRYKGELLLTLFAIVDWEGDAHAAEQQPGGITFASTSELRAGKFPLMELDIPMVGAVCDAAERHAASRRTQEPGLLQRISRFFGRDTA
jgi:8-oxo-dGTP diphosphatase